MKLRTIIFAFVVSAGFALSSFGTIIVNDTWADGNRTTAGPDGSGIDSIWYTSSSAASTVPAPGDLRWTIGAGSLFNTTYFPSAISPYGNQAVTLVNAGDSISVTWAFAMTGLNAGNINQNLALCLANTPGTHLSNPAGSASPSAQIYSGYAMFMNIAGTFNNASPFALKEWTSGTATSLLGSSGAWGANGVASVNLANDGASGNAGYAAGTAYTYQMTLTLNGAGGLDILSTMTGAGLNGMNGLTNSITDASPNSLTFDTFGVRAGTSSATASQFDTSLFKVEFNQVPEPATFALAGLGMLGLVLARRMRR
jgi:hypothetical protein